jgi:hypothetical protein
MFFACEQVHIENLTMAPTGEWTGFAATTSKGVISPVPIDADEVSVLKKNLVQTQFGESFLHPNC